ncbi:MAG: MBL fold metallo-hydrolase [Planctomycetaceae bacterium]|nr:MBL fold metallo-hydrolase [Planctomycetaceae bacterium]
MLPVHSLRVSNPFFEGANTVYLIESDPLTLIDTGVATEIAYERLLSQLKETGLRVEDIRRVILTHKHIDHIGNAWRIQQLNQAEILIHESEMRSIENVDAQSVRFAKVANQRLAAWQVPSGEVADSSQLPSWEIEPVQGSALRDGDEIDLGGGETMQVIHTPGHTRGSICLLYEDHLFSGDHILEDISPNVGGGDMRQQGLLKLFLQSLKRVQEIPGSPHVLPGHGDRFDGLAQRCQTLMDHHQERLDQIMEILNGKELTVYQVACELFGQLNDFHIFLGCAEANSHLEHLVEDRLLLERDGIFRCADASN